MKAKRSAVQYLEDIRDAMQEAENFVRGLTFEQFAADKRTNYAVVRALEIIGEAAKHVPPTIRKRYAELPWREMAGTRDKITHEYFGVDLAIVWKTVKKEIPRTRPLVEQALRDLSAEEGSPDDR